MEENRLYSVWLSIRPGLTPKKIKSLTNSPCKGEKSLLYYYGISIWNIMFPYLKRIHPGGYDTWRRIQPARAPKKTIP